jgi:hypothetical protein
MHELNLLKQRKGRGKIQIHVVEYSKVPSKISTLMRLFRTGTQPKYSASFTTSLKPRLRTPTLTSKRNL